MFVLIFVLYNKRDDIAPIKFVNSDDKQKKSVSLLFSQFGIFIFKVFSRSDVSFFFFFLLKYSNKIIFKSRFPSEFTIYLLILL